MKNILLFILFWLGLTTPTLAIEKKDVRDIDLTKFIIETQASEAKLSQHSNKLNLAWWIPPEYWEIALAHQGMPPLQRSQVMNLLRPYSMFGIVQANISPSGAFDFYSKDEVKKHLKIKHIGTDTQDIVELDPLKELSQDLGLLLREIQPMLASSMGQMGKNFHFFFVEDSGTQRILSPYKSGQVIVELSTLNGTSIQPLTLETPLNSLYVPRICPNGKEAHVSWQFCPWDGTKLTE